jgi:hypothetical protein
VRFQETEYAVYGDAPEGNGTADVDEVIEALGRSEARAPPS